MMAPLRSTWQAFGVSSTNAYRGDWSFKRARQLCAMAKIRIRRSALRAIPRVFSTNSWKRAVLQQHLDLTAAANLIAEFASEQPTLAILKHTTRAAWVRGPTCAKPGRRRLRPIDRRIRRIIAVNHPLDAACAEAIAEIFSEVIVP